MLERVRKISIDEYQYNLPDERIAKFPLDERDQSKLLVYRQGELSETLFSALPDLLPTNALLVFNNTRVIQARLHFYKESGAKIEIFCLEPYLPSDYALTFQSTESCSWVCMIGNLKKWKSGSLLLDVEVGGKNVALRAERIETLSNGEVVQFSWNEHVSFAQILECVGELPIPPYLNRATQETDKATYQTVYSKVEGSVAAPTAGLHFTSRVFDNLAQKNIECAELTLHVGAGTFKPVKTTIIGEHEMHTEYIDVDRSLIERLLDGRTVVAVGTTSVRTLESLYYIGCQLCLNAEATASELRVTQWMPYEMNADISVAEALSAILRFMERNQTDNLVTSTQIMIAPGYRFKIVKGIVTNFHQPSSTLLLLVSAFVGEKWRNIYDYALSHDFRFLSYGDSSLLL